MRKSAGIVAHNGKRFGALGRSTEAFKTSKIVSKDGFILGYNRLIHVKRMLTYVDVLVETFFSDTKSNRKIFSVHVE